MAGKVINSSSVLLIKFGASRQETALKTATSHIRKTLCNSLKKTDNYGNRNKNLGNYRW
jgi:hypothetical protein